ncbi:MULTISPECIES: amidohydrolase family protein [Corallincola]|uniref:Amidohydrolase n=2 Tax=Corallincola TaxID=1775176 RepID=A0A368NP85_9GAMM|nr:MULTISPECIES: amidohydrolase family protein [Corallincola]RCU51703.1 amidohydrolase [Corallincola holothuriorum]TAA47201.1 carboxyltransferase domain-containing protein [Corallincola spongiicola]
MKMTTKAITLIALLCSLLPWSASSHTQLPGVQQQQSLLIQDGNIHTGDGEVLKAYDLLIEGGMITALEPQIPAPTGAKVINANGQSIYPTLIALDTTLGLLEIDAVRASDDIAEVGSINPNVTGYVAFNADSELNTTTRSNGIGYAQVVPQRGLLSGGSSLMQLDGWDNLDALVIDRVGIHLRWPTIKIRDQARSSQSPEEQREKYQEKLAQLQTAFDQARRYFKSFRVDQVQAVDQRWQAMTQILNGAQPLFIHADDARDIAQAIAFAQREKVRMVLVGGAEADQVAVQLLRFNIPVIYTHSVGQPFKEDASYDSAYGGPARLQSLGIKYAIAYHNEGNWDVRNLPFAAGQAVAYGLTPEQALQAVTLSAAEILGVDDKLGSLRPGKQASLIIAPGDILDYSGHPITTMLIDGREVDLNNRQTQLYNKYKQRPATH